MLPSHSLKVLLHSKVLTLPAPAVTLTSSRGFLKHSSPNQNPSSPSKFRQKSTLTLNSPSIALPGAQDIYRPPKQKVAPSPEEEVAAETVSVPNTYQLPKSKAAYTSDSDPFSNAHLPKLDVQRFRSSVDNPLLPFCYPRKVKSDRISQYMQLVSPICSQEREEQSNQESNDKPLVLLYPWLMAKEKHVEKYTRLYTDLGIDVLRVNISPHDLLRPVPRAHVAAIQVLDYLLENQHWNKLLIHGLSVGAYGFMEVMTKMEENEDKYLEGIRPRFIGQIWDSPCDLPGLKEGVARSVSSNRAVQIKIMDFLEWFLHVRYEAATRHYIKTQDMYYKNYLNANSLFVYSRQDKVASPRIITDLANCYHDLGYEVFSNVFKESQHVGHFAKYREDYRANVMAFLHHIGLLRSAGINID